MAGWRRGRECWLWAWWFISSWWLHVLSFEMGKLFGGGRGEGPWRELCSEISPRVPAFPYPQPNPISPNDAREGPPREPHPQKITPPRRPHIYFTLQPAHPAVRHTLPS